MPITTIFQLSVLVFITGLLLGAILGAIVEWLFMRSRLVELDAARKLAEVNLAAAPGAGKMAETFQALADTALRTTQQTFLDSPRPTPETVRVEVARDLTQGATAVSTLI